MSTPFSHFFEKINCFSPQEHHFTEVLDAIAVKPKMLYSYGKMPENVVKTVAIVGARHNTKYGEEVTHKLAYELAKRGVAIISGLAFGIDSIAHRAALEAGGTTVAVLGTPINEIYPRNHLPLAKEIIFKGGAIISEYAPSLPEYQNAPLALGESAWDGTKWHSCQKDDIPELLEHPVYLRRRVDRKISFLHRNRIISGLADIVIVVEAAEKSGSLNTAAHALEQGKDIFAVPGNITSPLSQGCNRLIREGAMPYTCVEDILHLIFPEEFAAKHKNKLQLRLMGDTPVETAILQAIYAGERNGEDIIAKANLTPVEFNEAITMLEIKGMVRGLGGNVWGKG